MYLTPSAVPLDKDEEVVVPSMDTLIIFSNWYSERKPVKLIPGSLTGDPKATVQSYLKPALYSAFNASIGAAIIIISIKLLLDALQY